MDEKLERTLYKISQLANQNEEFADNLRRMLNVKASSANSDLKYTSLDNNVNEIRKALQIRSIESIDYTFIKERRLRDQLIIDNLRMENAALNLQELSEIERFYNFCANAFYQVENLLNYYYYYKYPIIENLLTNLEEDTKVEEERFRYKKPSRNSYNYPKSVADVPIASKINAFFNRFYPSNNIKIRTSSLRKVRNEGVHRCVKIIKSQGDSLSYFFKSEDFNTVRALLKEICSRVRKEVENLNKEFH